MAARRKKSSSRRSSSTGGGRKRKSGGSNKVGKVMHEYKEGSLRSGGSGRKVKSRKQAIAIGLSEAREAGENVPARRKRSRRKGS